MNKFTQLKGYAEITEQLIHHAINCRHALFWAGPAGVFVKDDLEIVCMHKLTSKLGTEMGTVYCWLVDSKFSPGVCDLSVH
mmetsp:Transcript_8386/g.13608  ORF Transcript_8386/g.13608 Transcript_8386/m.13608 type:complete len:81 (+) Transcript_8386:446-688(+)